MKDNKKVIGRLEASLTAISFGFLGVFGKWSFAIGFSVGELMAYRFLTAALILWGFALLFKRQLIKIPLKQIGIFALLGVFGYGMMSITYLTAIQGLSISTAVLILYTYPFWVMLISHFFTTNKITKKEVSCLLMAACGLGLLLGGHIEVRELWAVGSALLSAVLYSIYIVLSEKNQNGTHPLVSSLYVISFGALALLFFFRPSLPAVASFSQYQLFLILGIALLCTVLPLTLELSALQKIKSSEFSLLMMLEPVSAVSLGVIVFGERLEPVQIIGALTILFALMLRFNKTAKISEATN